MKMSWTRFPWSICNNFGLWFQHSGEKSMNNRKQWIFCFKTTTWSLTERWISSDLSKKWEFQMHYYDNHPWKYPNCLSLDLGMSHGDRGCAGGLPNKAASLVLFCACSFVHTFYEGSNAAQMIRQCVGRCFFVFFFSNPFPLYAWRGARCLLRWKQAHSDSLQMSEQRAQWIQPPDKPWVTLVSCAALIWGRRSLVPKWMVHISPLTMGFWGNSSRSGKRTSCSPTRESGGAGSHAQSGGNSVVALEETFTRLYSLGKVGIVGRRRSKQAGARGSITHTHTRRRRAVQGLQSTQVDTVGSWSSWQERLCPAGIKWSYWYINFNCLFVVSVTVHAQHNT